MSATEQLKPCPFCGEVSERRPFNDLTVIFYTEALRAKAETIEKTDIPLADKLAQSEMQTESTREYFKKHTEELKATVAELRKIAAGGIPA